MQYSSMLLLLATGLVSGAAIPSNDTNVAYLTARKCNKSGDEWSAEREYALNFASRACVNAFKGHYEPAAHRAQCYNLTGAKKVDFTVELRGDVSGRSITVEECYDGLQKEINACSQGGDTTGDTWRFRADPNGGQCAKNTH